LERLVQDSSDTYYEALRAAGIGWHGAEHDITPWLDYFLEIAAAAHKEFESRVGVVAGRGSKREAIRQFVRQSIAAEFTSGLSGVIRWDESGHVFRSLDVRRSHT
jgi:hypothetical protein